ncbi:MAG: Npt1/Npt2 family nucleotide transporter [Zetaproteobacteria bacterium]|nr:Npt1/Npt2 family nucleotide transporter [Zetaproteobacteria bacterium]
MRTGLIKSLKTLLPLEKEELPQFFVLSYCIFAIAFIYNFLRPLKVTLVASMSGSGAEVIPFLKLYGIIPASVLMTYLFTWLSRRYSLLQIIYVFLSFFLGYYALFGFVLFPYTEAIRLHQVSDFFTQYFPAGLKGLLACVEYWHISLFYVMCEIWVSSVLYLLFWGFVNERVHMSAAARWYPLLNLAGNCASIGAGTMGKWVAAESRTLSVLLDMNPSYLMTSLAASICLVLGCALVPFYRYAFLTMPVLEYGNQKHSGQEIQDDRVSASFWDSLKLVCTERYVLFLLVMVLAYNFTFNLTDVVWTQKVNDYYRSNSLDMAYFMSYITQIKGFISVVLALLAHLLIHHMGWRFSALVTPVVILLTSLLFFPVVLFTGSEWSLAWSHLFSPQDLMFLAIWAGGLQNATARSTKYSIYDSVREMVYVPLSHDMRRKAKAILDGIGGRMGKAMGSIVFMVLQVLFGSLEASLPAIAIISIMVTVLWVYSIIRMDQLMKAKLGSR